MTLRKDLDEARGGAHPAGITSQRATESAKAKTNETGKHTYTVQRGDTLASISRKFFKTSAHWKQILDANPDVIDNPKKLTAGQTLVIPRR
jgi:nucleoid-associated protein YgaU